jgi:hypothetical protein
MLRYGWSAERRGGSVQVDDHRDIAADEESAADREALERYYELRIREIRRGERRAGGSSWPLNELKQIARDPAGGRRSR